MQENHRRLFRLILWMLAANFADYISTAYALSGEFGKFAEGNPFMSAAVMADSFTLVKLLVPLLIGVYLMVRALGSASDLFVKRACFVMIFASLLFSAAAVHNSVRIFFF